MSLFQCDKCGCMENTALAGGGHMMYLICNNKVIASYKKVLGINTKDEFGQYCSACCPIWFNNKGNYGEGPIPQKMIGMKGVLREKIGQWHGVFERIYLPKGMFYTNADGNLAHRGTHSTKIDKYRIK